MSLSKGVGVFTDASGSSMASVPNAADSGNFCLACDEDGVITLATEERGGEPYCSNCATSQDERAYEASLEDYYGGASCQNDRERFDVDAMKGRH